MYDTTTMTLAAYQAPNVDFLAEVPCYLSDVAEIVKPSGVVVCGQLDALKVKVFPDAVRIGDASLCRYFLGSNTKTLTRTDTRQAVEKISDTLHLDVSQASVKRLDAGINVKLPHDVSSYLALLDYTPKYTRIEVAPTTIEYRQGAVGRYYNQMAFYDKGKEVQAKRAKQTDIKEDDNVLRIERRFLKRIPQQFGMKDVTASSLYTEAFYNDIGRRLYDGYKAIRKHTTPPAYTATASLKEVRQLGLYYLMEDAGGLDAVVKSIKSRQQSKELTKKQAHDLRAAFLEAARWIEKSTEPDPKVKILDNLIKTEIGKFCALLI